LSNLADPDLIGRRLARSETEVDNKTKIIPFIILRLLNRRVLLSLVIINVDVCVKVKLNSKKLGQTIVDKKSQANNCSLIISVDSKAIIKLFFDTLNSR
jgi:hypothetical protein